MPHPDSDGNVVHIVRRVNGSGGHPGGLEQAEPHPDTRARDAGRGLRRGETSQHLQSCVCIRVYMLHTHTYVDILHLNLSLVGTSSCEVCRMLTVSSLFLSCQVCRQLAYFAAGDLGTFDVIKLAYSLCTYYEVRPRKRHRGSPGLKYDPFSANTPCCCIVGPIGVMKCTWLSSTDRLSNSRPLLYPAFEPRHVSSPY